MPCHTAWAACAATGGGTIIAGLAITGASGGTATLVAVGTTILGLVAFHHAVNSLVDCLLTNNQIEYAHKLQDENARLQQEIDRLKAATGH